MRLLPIYLLICATTLGNAQTAVGTWKTVDDKSGEARSHISIYEQQGKLYGKIIRTLDPSDPPTCNSCSGERKGQPIIGMEIITAASRDGDQQWAGKIYDPDSDATYKLVMWLEEDPNVLYVRGKHWTGLYRTQTWERAYSESKK